MRLHQNDQTATTGLSVTPRLRLCASCFLAPSTGIAPTGFPAQSASAGTDRHTLLRAALGPHANPGFAAILCPRTDEGARRSISTSGPASTNHSSSDACKGSVRRAGCRKTQRSWHAQGRKVAAKRMRLISLVLGLRDDKPNRQRCSFLGIYNPIMPHTRLAHVEEPLERQIEGRSSQAVFRMASVFISCLLAEKPRLVTVTGPKSVETLQSRL